MKRTRTPPTVLILAMAAAALAFVWHQQVEVAAICRASTDGQPGRVILDFAMA